MAAGLVWLLLSVPVYAQGAATLYVQEGEPNGPPFGAFWYQPSSGLLKVVETVSPLTWGAVTGEAGGAAWGAITGTLSDQTDLQTALNGKQAAGTYATGTGTASGTNTGDQTSIVGITGTLAEFNTALTGADFATGGGTATGTNTGDQTITLTGNVTGSGTGSFAATIANDAVTYAKMQNVSATDRVLGRSTAGAGDVEEIVMTAAGRALVDDADAAAQRTTLGLGTVAPINLNGNAATYMNGTGAFTTPAGGSGDTVLTLAGDVSTAADTNLVNLTGMAFTADAAGIYKIEIWGDTQAAAATTGFGIGINCAQTPVKVALTGYSQLANTGTATAWSAIANNAIIGVTSGRPSTNTITPTHGGGLLVAHATTPGTCTFRLRSEVAAVVTMKANSLFIVRKVN